MMDVLHFLESTHFLQFLFLVSNVMMAYSLVLGGQCNDGCSTFLGVFAVLVLGGQCNDGCSTLLVVLVLGGQCNDGCSTFLGVHTLCSSFSWWPM